MWLYNGITILSINDFKIENPFGFIYITTHTSTGLKYLGKKVFYFNKKHKLTKKQLLEYTGKGRKPTHEVIQVESDWLTYYGSEDFIKNKIKQGKQNEFTREIIQIVSNKKLLTYYECKYQFTYGVIENKDWINNNVLGKFYRKDFE